MTDRPLIVEFVCNLTQESVNNIVTDKHNLAPGFKDEDRVFVEAGDDWKQIGANLIGPPRGNYYEGDVGVYWVTLRRPPKGQSDGM